MSIQQELDALYQQGRTRNGHQQRQIHNSEIPEPLIDSEVSDFGKARACPHCGSLSISIDLSTNKAVCTSCGEKDDTAHKVNFQKNMEDWRDSDNDMIEDAKRRGASFGRAN